MALENFRKMRITLTNANEAIYQKIVAKEGDTGGRVLEVQLIDGLQKESLSSVQVILRWKHLRHGTQGDANFQVVDASKGVFKVTYPEAMLLAGHVQAFIQINVGGDIISTRNFTIFVEGSGFDAQTAIASDDYQALNEALIEVNKYQSQIDSIKNNLQNQADALLRDEKAEFDDLQANYEPLLLGLQSQFDDVMANLTVDSELIAIRTSTTTGKSYSTASNRLDDMEDRQVVEDVDTEDRFLMSLEVSNGTPRLKVEEI